MTEIKAEIVRDTENIQCLLNVEGLSVYECSTLAKYHLSRAHDYLGGWKYEAALNALDRARFFTELSLKAKEEEEAWCESLPEEEAA